MPALMTEHSNGQNRRYMYSDNDVTKTHYYICDIKIAIAQNWNSKTNIEIGLGTFLD